MSSNVTCINMDARLDVRALFIQHKFHHLLVVNSNDEFIAVISESDYLKATNAQRPVKKFNDVKQACSSNSFEKIIININNYAI